MSVNRVTITGNLTRDPTLGLTPGGSQVLNFGVAVNDRRRNPSTGEWEDYPNFIDCIVFGNRADALARILYKGCKVAIEGKLRYSSWERDGQKRSKIEIYVTEIDLMQASGERHDRQTAQPAQPTYSAPPSARPAVQAPPPPVYDEDIPF